MEKILKILEAECTGCGVCSNVCPVNAIHMEYNKNGFLAPKIDFDRCIHCEKCDALCPIINKKNIGQRECYAVWADDEIRKKSSSGGMFSVLAESVIKKGGVVFGAAWTEDFYVKHIFVEAIEQLERLRKSKYVQSDVGDSYKQVKRFLQDNRTVMFTGTPCQIAGLINFLSDINTEKLLLVDFICYYNPPIEYLRRYLDETYGLQNLKEFNFRDKTSGWISHATQVILQSGEIIYDKEVSTYFKGYFSGLYARLACNNCTFSGGKHYSDITLGDFWKIEEHDVSLNDGKGTSMVISNTKKGKNVLIEVRNNLKKCKKVSIDWIREGQNNCKYSHPYREYFKELLSYKSFDEAIELALKGKFDIGMVCVQSYQNYGSAFTNFALYNVFKDMKKSVLIITQPLSSEIKPSNTNNFINNPFPSYGNAKTFHNQEEMRELNQRCKMFIVGSDQLFNYEIYRKIDGFIKLDWVEDNKKKVAYATSFGKEYILGPFEESIVLKNALKRFSAISIREKSGVDIIKNKLGLEATTVCDPVFLCNKNHYYNLCEDIKGEGDKVFAYILDPDMEKAAAIRKIAEKLKRDVIAIPDKWMTDEYVKSLWNIPTLVNQKNEVWMKNIMESEFIITDSFHGMCFSVIFEKQFVVLNNKRRGSTRFMEVLRKLNLEKRIFNSPKELIDGFDALTSINYAEINKKIELEKQNGIKWIKDNIIKELEFEV